MGEISEVILVHGLWYRAWSMRVLKGRLESCGFQVRSFSYPTRTASVEDNAQALLQFASEQRPPRQHFVAHSLGGLVTLAMLSKSPSLPPGRVVLMGTPLQGSEVARRVARWPGGPFLLGQSLEPLGAGRPKTLGGREIGMIAGIRKLGLGQLTGGVGDVHDGTVTLEETRSQAVDDLVELPVTHTGMLVSHEVAAQAAAFLRTGRFKRLRLR